MLQRLRQKILDGLIFLAGLFSAKLWPKTAKKFDDGIDSVIPDDTVVYRDKGLTELQKKARKVATHQKL